MLIGFEATKHHARIICSPIFARSFTQHTTWRTEQVFTACQGTFARAAISCRRMPPCQRLLWLPPRGKICWLVLLPNAISAKCIVWSLNAVRCPPEIRSKMDIFRVLRLHNHPTILIASRILWKTVLALNCAVSPKFQSVPLSHFFPPSCPLFCYAMPAWQFCTRPVSYVIWLNCD